MNPSMNGPLVTLDGVGKTFTLHLRGGTRLGVVDGVSFSVDPGECVVLGGPSGAGKSSLLRMIYGNYRCDTGRILIRDGGKMVDVASAGPRRVLALRRTTMGYVSQFLRVIPRVARARSWPPPGARAGSTRKPPAPARRRCWRR